MPVSRGPSRNASQVGLYLNPVNGPRDVIRRAGGKPKNHHREYLRKMREQQERNREAREAAEDAADAPKPQKFASVKSKCFSQAALKSTQVPKKTFLKRRARPNNSERAECKSPSASPPTGGTRLTKPIVPRQTSLRDQQKQLSSFADPAEWDAATTTQWVRELPDNFAWIAPLFEEINMTGPKLLDLTAEELAFKFRFSKPEAATFRRHLLARCRKAGADVNYVRKNLKPTQPVKKPEEMPSPLHKSYGKVPKYLQQRKEQKRQAAEDAKRAAEQAKIPAGMRLMTEEERLATMEQLKENKLKVQMAIRALPLRCETLKLRQRSNDLNEQLDQLEKAMQTFSRKKIFIDLET